MLNPAATSTRATTSPTTAPRAWLKSIGPVGLELTNSTWTGEPRPSSLLPHDGPASAIGRSCACSHTGSSVILMKPGAATEVRPNEVGNDIASISSLAIAIGGRRSVRASLGGGGGG